MKSVGTKENSLEKKQVISSTGYRTLIVLQALLQNDLSIEELVDLLKADSLTDKALSKDTVRICLNTLKNSGCKISRPTKSNNYKYHLVSHPFKFTLSEYEMKILFRLRDLLIKDSNWHEVLKINALLQKIASLTDNKDKLLSFDTDSFWSDIKNDVFAELTGKEIFGKKVQIEYLSPEFGLEDIFVVPHSVVYENDKLYLKCYALKYEAFSFLDAKRITKIKSISIEEYPLEQKFYDVVYTLEGNAAENFIPKENEIILRQEYNKVTVKAQVTNEFTFIQRLLLFGSDFKVISPKIFKEKLINKLKLICNKYD